MTHGELKKILTEQSKVLDAKATTLKAALTKMIPSALSIDEQKILNQMGMTVASSSVQDNPQVEQVKSALSSVVYHLDKVNSALKDIPNGNTVINVTSFQSMDWDMVGDVRFL